MTTAHQKLQSALKKRKTLESDLQKLKGKLEVAQTNLTRVENSCRKRGLEPENLSTIIEELSQKYEAAVDQFVADVESLEQSLTKFLEE